VLRSRDQEIVGCAKPALCDEGLKAGDGVRFNPTAGLALEKVEASKGDEYFLEETPADSFEEIGGLEMEIDQLKRLMALHIFQPGMTTKYKLPRKRSSPDGRTAGHRQDQVARSTCNWLAGLSQSGRSRFHQCKARRNELHVVRRDGNKIIARSFGLPAKLRQRSRRSRRYVLG